jgi:hypothetical protein
MATWDALYTQQYDSNLRFASQQRESRLIRTVTIDKMAGVNKYFEKILSLGPPGPRTSRFAPVTLQDTPFERRVVTPISYSDARGVDSLDKLRTMVEDPTSKIMMSQLFAFHRLVDSTIISAAGGSAMLQASVNAAFTSVSLPSSQAVAVTYAEPGTGQSGNTGFTVGKIKYAKALLEEQEAIEPGEEIFCIITSAQKQQLLRDPQVTNLFYNESRPLMTGDVATFLGVTFIRSELLTTTTTFGQPFTGQSTALVYPRSALEFAWLEPLHGRVDPRYDLDGEVWQMKALGSFGATRMYEERVVTIASDNTV